MFAQLVGRPAVVRAIEKYKVICEHGSQCRSSPAIIEAMDQMKNGLIGDVYFSRGLCYKWRDTIGHASPEPVPAGVDYDLWTGPAPMKPLRKTDSITNGIGFGTRVTAISVTRGSTNWI